MATNNHAQTIYLKDYTVPDFILDEVFLHFDLLKEHTVVSTVQHCRRNPDGNPTAPLVLFGEAMELQQVRIDGKELTESDYEVDAHQLVIPNVPDKYILETVVVIKPHENTTLSGLYQSRGNYCTQCESHGFRRITYFLDRSDVLTKFTTTITADKDRYPVMLSNGNLIEDKLLEGGRRWVKWEDPSLKPSYLFALVAGDYEYVEDTFTTMSGRDVKLQVYVEQGNLDQTAHAVESLKRAMKWDEDAFGREYDLDMYMIVAVSDFNMGAMENKGLNVFNDKYILAKPETATDQDYIDIESVIGHEYFHNWSGNRVTVRDWFQITLKEGLTIFRDQSFTADMRSSAVKRIKDVFVLRNAQFPQDSGPMAHPIRPESYIEVNNFYTVTVYNKGSEVIRMQQTLLGPEKFRQAMDTYFTRFDGKAVTTDDFTDVMAEVGGIDLTQFKRWYSQAGTPRLTVKGSYDSVAHTYTLEVEQNCPPTPGQANKKPFHIPFAVGLVGKEGQDLELQLESGEIHGTTAILNVTESSQRFTFVNVPQQPVPSLLRNFSAPVKVVFPYSTEQLTFLMQHDSDGFNQWDACQQLACNIVQQGVFDYRNDKEVSVPQDFINALSAVLQNQALDKLFVTEVLNLPATPYLIEQMDVADVEGIYHVRKLLKQKIATELRDLLWQTYQDNHDTGEYSADAAAMGRRAIKNQCLWYLTALEESEILTAAYHQFSQANNLTDVIGALHALNNVECDERNQAFAEFYDRRKHQHLVVDKWFALQAVSCLPGTLDTVKALMQHQAFDFKNPNRVNSLLGFFASKNYLHFHSADGSGYQFLTDQVLELDSINPQVAARLVQPLIRWRKYDQDRQQLMRNQLERIVAKPTLSKDVYELAHKSLEENV